MWPFSTKPAVVPAPQDALKGRASSSYHLAEEHFVLKTKMLPPYPEGIELAMFGLGCFWGAERAFWQLNGVYTTAVGYAGGYTTFPTYKEVCSGKTGHNEVVMVAFDPTKLSYRSLLRTFFEKHNPTQGMRQGNDVGTQYRSGVYWYDKEQKAAAEEVMAAYGQTLKERGFPAITTEVSKATDFYFAEEYHQQYLAKNPGGYCGLGGTGITCST